MTSATTRVQWLGSGAQPPQLMAHLKTRGLSLGVGGELGLLPPARLTCLGAVVSPSAALSLVGRRVAVLHPDPGAADALAQSLRTRGGTVTVLSLNPAALGRVEGFDPDAVLVEPADFMGGCWEIVRALWMHPRLRWAPIVLTPAEPPALGSLSLPDPDLVCQTITELSAEYDALRTRAASTTAFDGRLSTLGPARTLRALIASGATLRVRIESSARAIELDLADHLVVGAHELDAEERAHALLGPAALAHVLGMDQAKISVKRAAAPAVTNVMAALDDALQAARRSSDDGSMRVGPARPAVDVSRGAPHVHARSPSAARVYPFPAPMPAPPTALRALSAQPPRAIPPPHGHAMDRGRPVASAVALNIDVECAESVAVPLPAAPLPDPVPRRLESGIVETLPQALPGTWEPPELNSLLAERKESHSTPAGGVSSESLSNSTPHYPTKKSVRATLVAVCALCVISLLVRRDEPNATPMASAASAGSALRIRIHKLAPAPQDTGLEENSEEEGGGNPTKAASRRASELVSTGHALRRDGKLAQAGSLYREALKVYPGYPRAFAGLSRLAMQQGDGATALRHARALVRARPEQPASHLLLGDAERAVGNILAAKRAWTLAARRGDRVAKSRLN